MYPDRQEVASNATHLQSESIDFNRPFTGLDRQVTAVLRERDLSCIPSYESYDHRHRSV